MLLVGSNWSIPGAIHWQKTKANSSKLFLLTFVNITQWFWVKFPKNNVCIIPTYITPYICIQTHFLSWIMSQTNLETPWANKRTGPSSLVIYWHEWEIECHFSNKTDDFSNISRLARKTPSWQIWECQQEIPNILFPCCFSGDINNLTFVVLKSTKGGKIPETSFWWD